MIKTRISVNGEEVELVIHDIEGDISEVYAYWNDDEILFAYSLDEMNERLARFFVSFKDETSPAISWTEPGTGIVSWSKPAKA